MAAKEAEDFGLRADQARHYFRLDRGKANYSAVWTEEWFERETIILDNGDDVGAVRPWTPPTAEAAVSDDTLADLLAAVADGERGAPWTARLGKYDRSISRAMERFGITSRTGQQRALDALYQAGVTNAAFIKANRQPAEGLRHPDGRPEAKWRE